MGVSNFDIVQANNNSGGGKIFYVNNATTGLPEGAIGGSNGNSGLSPLEPLSTVDYAVGLCSAGRGDKIYVLPGHAETYSTAGALALDVANVEIIGIGVGDNRPTFTFSNTAATIAQSGNGTKLMNVILVPSVDSVVSPLAITGDGCEFDITVKDASDAVEFVRGVLATGADRLKGKIEYHGRTGGDACVNAVRLIGCAGVELHVDLYGKASTAWVETLTTACTNITIDGYMYNSGTTNGSKDFVDTATGSTWAVKIFDGSAGAEFSGSSGAALASDDVSALASTLLVPTADVATNTNERDVIGNKTDAVLADTVEGTSATTKSLVAMAKSIMQRIGADSANNSAATTLVTSNADGSVFERLEYVQTDMLSLPRCVEKSDGSVTSGTDDLFTITGGPIKILEITGIVTTIIGAGATNVKLQITTTDPAATVDMNAGAVDIDSDAVGTSYQTINTTGIFTPVTAGYVKEANSFATLPTTFLAPIGTIKFNSDASRTGNIKWYLRYVPLSPNSRVVAAA